MGHGRENRVKTVLSLRELVSCSLDVKELVLDLEDERVVIPTERGGGYGTIERVTDGMCVIVRDDEGGVDMDGKGLPSRLEVHVDELVHAPREKILPYYKAEVLKAQVSIRQQLVKFKKDKKFDIEPTTTKLPKLPSSTSANLLRTTARPTRSRRPRRSTPRAYPLA